MAASFHQFHESWTDELHKLTSELTKTSSRLQKEPDDDRTRRLVNKVVTHYEDYYRARESLARSDVLAVFSAPWDSAIERALHWVGGFRPTTIFHLVYTESSARFQARVFDILQGISTGDLGELSPSQLARVSELQCETVQEENEVGEQLGAWQDELARAELNWAATGLCVGPGNGLEELPERLEGIVARADGLRVRTIKKVVELLTPQQGLEFLIATIELQFGIRGWGTHHDRLRARSTHS